jgi:UDP-N-acetylglucosamine 2-epimerase (non-hydrolysing)
LTLRDNTERPITVTQGTNTIVGTDRKRILAELEDILSSGGSRGMWDGHTADRVVDVILKLDTDT